MTNKRFVSLKTKIIISTLIPIAVSVSLIAVVIFVSLVNSYDETAKAELSLIGQKYAANFEDKIVSATDYISFVSSMLEYQIKAGTANRENMREAVLKVFKDYKLINRSGIYFEPNTYDGKDADYIGSEYGSSYSGRICYYFYMDNGEAAYLTDSIGNDLEFGLSPYIEAKQANRPIYTKPDVYEIDGKYLPMFTLVSPVKDDNGNFLGAVTVDLLLGDIYEQLQSEKIYKTGYVIVSNDSGRVIYSPKLADIGRTRVEAGVAYALPSWHDAVVFSHATSSINGKACIVATTSVSIPALERFFYISVAAPLDEVNANGRRLILTMVAFIALAIMTIIAVLYHLIGKISAPIKEITESANKIANGDLSEATSFVSGERDIGTNDEVFILFESMKKMLTQLDGVQRLKLEALELKHEKERAETAAQAKNDFLAKMSHEIRTPMNAVMGMIELILRRDLPQDVYESALIIKSASTHLLSIINDILDFSKIESGRMEIVEAEYAFSTLVRDVINTVRIRLIDKPVQFVVDVDPNIPAHIIGDEVRFRQVIINILNNAAKYTQEGFIRFSVTGSVSGGYFMFKIDISDSGCGIKEEDLNKLFGDFVQVNLVGNKNIEGTGLGLAISRNLCEMMNGDISVSSEYGKGSIFTISIPQKLKDYEPFAAVEDPFGKSALVYETREYYRESVIEAIENLGVSYKSVNSVSELFENLDQFKYIFISSFMYGSIHPALPEINTPELVLLSDITETLAPKNVKSIRMPTHVLDIANIFNDTHEDDASVIHSGASFIAPQAKILIVDDIFANLKVSEGLMSPYEFQITLCTGGRESVELVANNEYDLVFMDHMMPDMDGIEATNRIRAMDGEYFASLPIIALTANAVSGVKEMFLQNGMNDFLSKPIETSKLDAILEKWIPKDKRQKVLHTEKLAKTNEFVKLLRTVGEISVDKALSIIGGSEDTYEKMVKLSIRLLPENVSHLNELIDSNLPDYAIEVHGVKGVLNNIGAYTIGLEAFELEKLSKQGEWVACKQLHPKLITSINELLSAIANLSTDPKTKDKALGNLSVLKDVLSKIRQAAAFYDSEQAAELMTTIADFSFGDEIDTLVSELGNAIEGFDFYNAATLVDKLEEICI